MFDLDIENTNAQKMLTITQALKEIDVEIKTLNDDTDYHGIDVYPMCGRRGITQGFMVAETRDNHYKDIFITLEDWIDTQKKLKFLEGL